MKSRKAYNRRLRALKKMKAENEQKYGHFFGNDNYINAFKLGYQTRITDELIEKEVK